MAAAGQGAVGLRSRGGRKGCTKRLAKKASGWEQKKTGQNRGQKWGGGLSKAGEQRGAVSEQANTKGEAEGGEMGGARGEGGGPARLGSPEVRKSR